MPIEIKEIVVKTTISDRQQKVVVPPELIRKLKREVLEEVKLYIAQNSAPE
jgi:hypothetical protein